MNSVCVWGGAEHQKEKPVFQKSLLCYLRKKSQHRYKPLNPLHS